MRKYIVILTIGILALGVCSSCRRGRENPEDAAYALREDVVFTASASGYVPAKASDSALEDGDEIGIFALDPIDALNVKGTLGQGKVTTEVPVKWGLGQKEVSRFAAYLPYMTGTEGTDLSFSVRADQSSYAGYSASDLRYAVTDAVPGTPVDFLFQHSLSKLVVVMETTDVEVESVVTGELVTGVRLNLVDGNVEETALKGTVTMGKAVSANGGEGHVAILVPQKGVFPLTVTLKGGTTINAVMPSTVTLMPGMAYKAVVGLAGTFRLTVTDWADDGEMPYINKGA